MLGSAPRGSSLEAFDPEVRVPVGDLNLDDTGGFSSDDTFRIDPRIWIHPLSRYALLLRQANPTYHHMNLR